jgi:histidinol-phosphate aminotransferase
MADSQDHHQSSSMFREELLAFPAYSPGKAAPQDGFKLSSNENPFPTLPSVLAAVQGVEDYNRYPENGAGTLVTRLASIYGVQPENVVVGSGSISLLLQAFLATCETGDEVIYPWRSFEGYPSTITVSGATKHPVPVRPDGSHDLEAMAEAIGPRTRVILLSSPNNPSSNVLHRDEVERFLARVPENVLVLLDEAYIDFVRDSEAVDGLALLEDHPNLVTMRTFSKAYALPGMRLGYAIGAELPIRAIRAAGLPFNVTSAAIAAAIASLDAREELMQQVETIVATRNRVLAGLIDQGWDIPDPQGNFVWLPVGDAAVAAGEVFERHGIIARVFAGAGVRVSIGEEASVEPLLAAAAEIIAG